MIPLPPSYPTNFDESLLAQQLGRLENSHGESLLDHAKGVLSTLQVLAADTQTQQAGLLFFNDKSLPTVEEVAGLAGNEVAQLVKGVRRVLALPELYLGNTEDSKKQAESLRKLMLALAADVRVLVILLASRLETLRHYAQNKHLIAPRSMLLETGDVWAPLANRLGIWQLKWELEDLYFRFSEPLVYKELAGMLEEKRAERERYIASICGVLEEILRERDIHGKVYGRPKHIFSIAQKMRSKGRPFDALRDLRAFRVIVPDLAQCYEVLSLVQAHWKAVPGEFDDYIARPKINGYQSIHIVLEDDDTTPPRQFELQIRTQAMHEFAEFGVAAHWRYKEGAQAPTSDSVTNIAYVRQLLSWQQELGHKLEAQDFRWTDDRIYTLTPAGRIVELPIGATPVDFAYHVHTDLGHRCRGAKVDGHMVALNHALRNGQTVDILTARKADKAGPSRDWLNPELGYVQSQRGRAKVRQWFNGLDLARDLDSGRAVVERAMQREGKTGLPLDELASRLGFAESDELFLSVNRETIGPRALELALRGQALDGDSEDIAAQSDEQALRDLGRLDRTDPKADKKAGKSGTKIKSANVLVVGADFLLTSLSKCCHPIPPDKIQGFVTRGKGVSIHRYECKGLAALMAKSADRVLDCTWDDRLVLGNFTAECALLCEDRQGLLRDVSDVFARNKINVRSVRSLSQKDRASMRFTVEVPNLEVLNQTLILLLNVKGVVSARRKAL